jgi:hypothetical protein
MKIAVDLSSIIALLIIFQLSSNAQPYMEGGNTRHRFAQMAVGASFQYFSNRGAYVQDDPITHTTQTNPDILY